MQNILSDKKHSYDLLMKTAGTLLLLDEQGVCVDLLIKDNGLWFMKEEILRGKNILNLFPYDTYRLFYPHFREVLTKKIISSENYELVLDDSRYYFHCTMQPYQNYVLCQYRDITKRSIKNQELGRRNRELSEIQKAALLGNWVYSTLTQELRFSGHVGVFDGLPSRNFPIEDFLKMILPDDLSNYIMWGENLIKGNVSDTIIFRIQVNGKISHIRAKCYTREKHKDGSVTLEGFSQNITEIQQNRNDVNMLLRAVNNAVEDIFAADEDGFLVFGNRSFLTHHRINPNTDYTGVNISDLSPMFSSPEEWRNYAERVKQGRMLENFVVDNPVPCFPEILAMEANAYWIADDKGKGTVWSFGRDITKRIESENQLKHFNLILNKTIENLPASIVVKDIKNGFKYLYRNRESFNRQLNGREVIGKDDFEYHSYEEALQKRREDISIAQTGEELHWVSRETDSDGNLIYIDKRKLRIDDEGGNQPLLLSIDWDITERENMKLELIKAKEKAETSDRLKSAFLANMSHEIRTPLNAIVGFSRIIAETDSAQDREAYYGIIEENNERLLKLVNEILDLSKIEANMIEFSLRNISLHELCEEVAHAFQFRCPSGVKLVFVDSDELLMAYADHSRVFQVVSNLISNALKFTVSGTISYGYRLVGGEVEFFVSDTGNGIEPEKLDKVFDRFVKANDIAQGSGLGLSICKMLIEKMGGTIRVESEVGKGTTFSFTLPPPC